MITTVVVTSQRPQLLARCLESLVSNSADVFVVINGEDPENESRKLCDALAISFLHLSAAVTPAQARNLAIQNVQTPWIHFLDDDAFVDLGFYEKAKEVIRYCNMSVIGGPNLTPRSSDFFQTVSGLALASPWGAGPCHRRYTPHQSGYVCGDEALILCNLFVKKEIFTNEGFSQNFFCGEENDFLARLEKNLFQFYFSPELSVWHERRKSIFAFLAQIWNYGVGRGQNMANGNFKFYHLIPLLSVSLFHWFPSLVLFYFGLNISFSMSVTTQNKRGWQTFVTLFFLFPLIHFQYAVGSAWGLIALRNILESGTSFFKALKLSSKKNFE